MLISATFTTKFELVFVITLENAFSQRFHFKTSRTNMGASMKQYQGFSKQPWIWEIGLLLCDNHWTFWMFSILWLLNKFSEKRNLFQKTRKYFFSWKYQNWRRSISMQNSLSEANVRTDIIEKTKWTSDKERSFAKN